MNEEKLKFLLLNDESTNLDWKRQLPEGLDGKKADPKSFEKAKAEFIKDIASMANVREYGCGYIIYGFIDRNGQREPFEDTSTFNFDDASIRQMLESYLEPLPAFECYQVKINQHVARIIKVDRVPAFPHVIKKSLGGIIHKGQVFYRAGTSTEIATYSVLNSMFDDFNPLNLNDPNGTEGRKITLHYEKLGRDCGWPSVGDEHERLLQGWEHGYQPGTRRKVFASYNMSQGRRETILMVKPKSPPS